MKFKKQILNWTSSQLICTKWHIGAELDTFLYVLGITPVSFEFLKDERNEASIHYLKGLPLIHYNYEI